MGKSKDPKYQKIEFNSRKAYIASQSYLARQREEANQKLKEQNEKRKELDVKYTTVVSVILREIQKRDISSDDPEFNIKIDQIVEMLQQNPFFKRFKEDSVVDIRNAVKRRINKALNIQLKSEEGPEL